MFLIENAIPFKNGMCIQGKFQTPGIVLNPGDQFAAIKNGIQVGIVLFRGIMGVNYTHDPKNPRYHLSVGCGDCDYRALIGTTLIKI